MSDFESGDSPAADMRQSDARLPTMFGEPIENNITFCVDSSGSMYKYLEVVKDHLIETLTKHANRNRDTMFNIIEFSSDVTQWADKMVKCTPETVIVAKDWVKNMAAKAGTNTQDALLTALTDQGCEAVYIVTDGLPDQHPSDILDQVVYASDGRPIHCIYLAGENINRGATEFLEDLAVDTYGSFHIVTLTTHGCVDKISPVYRADHAQERIIRTVNGTLRPNVKHCSVGTTLQIEPEDYITPRLPGFNPYLYPPPWTMSDWMSPHRYYHPYMWSRYRPARGWMKAQDQVQDAEVSPTAGALLIGKKILARRQDDGYYYMGTVKSQILADKFLVSFGPCKHGKYRDTVFQETYIHDIIDYNDAKRHAVLTGDKVLAPWEPEGEKYGPGVVIEGQERRQNEGPENEQVTVTFSNGKSKTISVDTALWIPVPVYDRVSFELNLPKHARETLSSHEQYPSETLPGYPTSGPMASPVIFDRPDPIVIDPMMYSYPPYSPNHPMFYRYEENNGKISKPKITTAVDSEEMNAIIPGTDMTRGELNEKVMSQLMENKLLLDIKQSEKSSKDRLLAKREKQEMNSLRKSVSFNEDVEVFAKSPEMIEDIEADPRQEVYIDKPHVRLQDDNNHVMANGEQREDVRHQDYTEEDHYRDMTADFYGDDEERYYRDMDEFYRVQEMKNSELKNREKGVNTDYSLLYRSSSKLPGRRPSWRYWRNDPSPPVNEKSSDPFRETALAAPLEARDQRASPYITEWTSPITKYVDPYARHCHLNSVELLMKMPHPPSTYHSNDRSSENQSAGNYTVPMGGRQISEDARQDARRDFRRRHVMQRQQLWNEKISEHNHMKFLMQDQHRERIEAQLAHEQARQHKEQQTIHHTREVKKKISAEMRAKIEENQYREQDRETQRIQALTARRERREDVKQQRESEIQDTVQRRQEIKQQRSQERWQEVNSRLDQEEVQNTERDKVHRHAKVKRIEHFRKMEAESQKAKDLRIGVADQNLAMYRSQVLP